MAHACLFLLLFVYAADHARSLRLVPSNDSIYRQEVDLKQFAPHLHFSGFLPELFAKLLNEFRRNRVGKPQRHLARGFSTNRIHSFTPSDDNVEFIKIGSFNN